MMSITNRRPKILAGAITCFLCAVGLMTVVLQGAAWMSTPAKAEAVCVDHAVVVKTLEVKHAEKQVAMGLAGTGVLIEVFSTKDGETWTLVRTMPDGTSCVVAAGEAWSEISSRRVDQIL